MLKSAPIFNYFMDFPFFVLHLIPWDVEFTGNVGSVGNCVNEMVSFKGCVVFGEVVLREIGNSQH